eukprot:4593601-Pleurochrysis_carterae.AAC.1
MEVFMMREKDGRSKGCAFVRFYTKHAADAACATLNGTMSLPGAARALVVKYADASEPRGSPMAIPQHGGRASYGHKPPMPAPPHMMGAASYSPAMSMPMGDQQWMGMATSPNAILASSPPGAVPMQLGMQCARTNVWTRGLVQARANAAHTYARPHTHARTSTHARTRAHAHGRARRTPCACSHAILDCLCAHAH